MRHKIMRAIGAVAIVGGSAGGLVLSGTFASASPKAPAASLGSWAVHVAFYNDGSFYYTGVGHATFGKNHVDTITGIAGTYTYSALNGKVTFEIDAGCYPLYTLYGSKSTGFGGTIHCTAATSSHENGYVALGSPPGFGANRPGAQHGGVTGARA